MNPTTKRIDIIVPVYNEQEVLRLFFESVFAVVDKLSTYEFRLIMVNDGSHDQTLELLLAERSVDDRVEVIDLSRNFGHEGALAAGLKCSTGDAAIVMDADLQDPPELIFGLVAAWEKGFDVVNAHRSTRPDDSLFKRWTAKQFYRTINSLSEKVKIPENVGNYRLISRRVVETLNQLPEKNRVFRVLIPYLGFDTIEVEFVRPKRPAGKTHYNYNSMVRLAVDGITSATTIPLKFAINVGALVALAGFCYLTFAVVMALATHNTVPGWLSTVTIVLLLGGIQLLFLGVIGEYIGRIFLEIKSRPDHIVRRHYGSGDNSSSQK